MPSHLRILLADDHAVLRQITAILLDEQPDLEVVGEAQNGQEAIDLVQRLLPDIVIMDVQMPVLSGLEATRFIHAKLPTMPVLALTAEEDPHYVRALLNAGACGYLLKTSAGDQLVNAVRLVGQGGVLLDPEITAALEEADIVDLYRMARRNTSSVLSASARNRPRRASQEKDNT